jgi:uncharacterized integral membrane protein
MLWRRVTAYPSTKGRKRTSAERERSDGEVTKATMQKLNENVDPVLVLGVFLLVVFMIMSVVNHIPVTIPMQSQPLIVLVFLAGMGTGSPLLRLKQARERRRAERRR